MITTQEHINSLQYNLQRAKDAKGSAQIHHGKQTLEQAFALKNGGYAAKASFLLAENYISQGRYKTAQHYLNRLKADFDSYLDERQKYALYALLTETHLHLSEWGEALLNAFSALKMNQDKNNVKLYNNISIAFNHLGKHSKAMSYLEKALTIAKDDHNPQGVCACLISMGVNLAQQDKIDAAVNYFEQAQSISKSHYIQEYDAIILGNLAKSYERIEQWDKAIAYIEQSVEISQKEEKVERTLTLKHNLSQIYVQKEQYAKANYFLDEVNNHPKINDYPQLLLSNLDLKQSILAKEKNFEAAYNCLCELRTLEEEQYKGNRDKKLTQLIEEQELEISLLEERNQQIQQQSNMLEQHNKELQQLAFVVAHDLKEPLRTINGFTQLLLKDLPEELQSAAQQTYAKHITDGVIHMRNLLDDLLIYTGIRHQTNTNHKHQSPKLILDSTLFALRDLIGSSSAQIVSRLNETQGVAVKQQHLFLLLKNLLHNAIKFHKPNATPKVSVSMVNLDEGMCLFSIKDNGIGIAEHYQAQIFKIFNRLDKQNYKGTGIGLAICEKIVQLYGGEIWVTSKQGVGTTFHFTLPQTQVSKTTS